MKINILFGDIFSVACDAYGNPTDVRLSGSGGLDRQFHLRGGEALEAECLALRSKMKPGSTAITSGGNLPVKYILHTACPDCREEPDETYPLLAACYRNMLAKAAGKPDIHHLAIPLIGTGVSGYSLQTPRYAGTLYSLTAVTILAAIASCASNRLQTVTIVCSSKEKYDILQKTYRWIFGRGISKRSRIRGSLLGGAIGDALGYPVEFNDAAGSRIREYQLNPRTGTALISDDTQMTLFTACGLLWGYSRSCMKGIGGDLWHYIGFAYDDWLKTQRPDYEKQKFAVSWIRNIPELIACRAPGITCLSALEAGGASIDKPINNSKGCGGVMRIAPIALYMGAHHRDPRYNARCCAEAAAITHGHPLGWISAAALGNILFDIMRNFSLQYAVWDTILLLRKEYADYPDTEVMVDLLLRASDLADISGNTSSVDLITEYDITRQLGEGWVGEEALAVGLFCALAGVNRGLDQCLWNAVGHQGDSDSTASIAGQIWGAYFGEEAIAQKWLKDLELRDVITEIADDLTNNCRMSEYGAYYDPAWVRKYLSGDEATHIPGPGEYPSHRYIQIPWREEPCAAHTVTPHNHKGNDVEACTILIEDGIIYHVSQKQACAERHGFVHLHPGGTVTGYYNNTPFILIPNHADKWVEIFSHTSPSPWIGTIRRRFDEWDNPVEVEFKDHDSGISLKLLEILVSDSNYLRDFFA